MNKCIKRLNEITFSFREVWVEAEHRGAQHKRTIMKRTSGFIKAITLQQPEKLTDSYIRDERQSSRLERFWQHFLLNDV